MNVTALREQFAERFDRACDVVARAPGRVNLIGEHTDYNDGFVLPIALERGTWVACGERDDRDVRVWSDHEGSQAAWTLGAWQADSATEWSGYVAGVAELLRERGARLSGFDLLIRSDLPIGAGLGSSAALCVATGLALAYVAGEPLESNELIDLCATAERRFRNAPCGIMDQSVSLLARAGAAFYLDCRSRDYRHIEFALHDVSIVVIDSGVRHSLASGEYRKRREQCAQAVAYFQKVNPHVRALRDVSAETVRAHVSQMNPSLVGRALHVTSEIERTQAGAKALETGNARTLGKLMSASHVSLREDYEVSCPALDRLLAAAQECPGVLGARMTGAGFGGCAVCLVESGALEHLAAALQSNVDDAAHPAFPPLVVRPGAGAALERT